MKHGGKREGAGRKPKEGVLRKINVRLKTEEWERVDKIADETSLTEAISSLVSKGLKK